MEGFLARLLDTDDAIARQLRALATLHVVPHMNLMERFVATWV